MTQASMKTNLDAVPLNSPSPGVVHLTDTPDCKTGKVRKWTASMVFAWCLRIALWAFAFMFLLMGVLALVATVALAGPVFISAALFLSIGVLIMCQAVNMKP